MTRDVSCWWLFYYAVAQSAFALLKKRNGKAQSGLKEMSFWIFFPCEPSRSSIAFVKSVLVGGKEVVILNVKATEEAPSDFSCSFYETTQFLSCRRFK